MENNYPLFSSEFLSTEFSRYLLHVYDDLLVYESGEFDLRFCKVLSTKNKNISLHPYSDSNSMN